jgi:hypothetical protein
VPEAPIKQAEVKEPVRPLPKPEPSAEEERLAKERSLAEKLIAARQAAHDTEMRRRDDEGRRLDGERQAAADQQRQLEDNARTAAGLGYRLRENCDAFSWYRDQYPLASKRARTCYLFRKPFVTANYPGYAFGEPGSPRPHEAGQPAPDRPHFPERSKPNLPKIQVQQPGSASNDCHAFQQLFSDRSLKYYRQGVVRLHNRPLVICVLHGHSEEGGKVSKSPSILHGAPYRPLVASGRKYAHEVTQRTGILRRLLRSNSNG